MDFFDLSCILQFIIEKKSSKVAEAENKGGCRVQKKPVLMLHLGQRCKIFRFYSMGHSMTFIKTTCSSLTWLQFHYIAHCTPRRISHTFQHQTETWSWNHGLACCFFLFRKYANKLSESNSDFKWKARSSTKVCKPSVSGKLCISRSWEEDDMRLRRIDYFLGA